MAKCKSCGGNNAKKLSIVEKMGTETGTASTTGIGVSGGGVGVGFGKTSINKKSNLAKEASYTSDIDDSTPFSKFGFYLGGLVFAIFWVFNDKFFEGFISLICIWSIFAFIGLISGQSSRRNQGKEEERQTWDKTWMCLDCGHKWVNESGVSDFAVAAKNKINKSDQLLKKNLEEKGNKKYSKLKKRAKKNEKEIIKKTRWLRFTKDKNIANILNELEVLEKEKDKLLQSKAEQQKYDELMKTVYYNVGILSSNPHASIYIKKRKQLEDVTKEINILLDSEHKWVESGVSNSDSPREATNKKYAESKKEINKKEKEIIKKTQQISFTKNKKLKETIKKELEALEKEKDKLLPKKAEIQKYDELEKEIDRKTKQMSFTKNKELKETIKKELEVLEEEINKLFS